MVTTPKPTPLRKLAESRVSRELLWSSFRVNMIPKDNKAFTGIMDDMGQHGMAVMRVTFNEVENKFEVEHVPLEQIYDIPSRPDQAEKP